MIDPEQFKEQQKIAWDKMAHGWKKWWPLFEKYGTDISQTMIEKAEVDRGARVLDFATGIGEPALTAATTVGPGGYVLATDISEEMVNLTTERVDASGFTNIRVVQSDIATLDLSEELPFDAVLCRLGIMLIPELEKICTKIHNSLRDDGKFVATVFSTPPKAPIVGHAAMIIQSTLQPPKGLENAPGIFSLADPTPLTTILQNVGFSDVDTQTISHSFVFDNAGQFRDFTRDLTPPINLTIKGISDDMVANIWRKVAQTAKDQYEREDGKIEVENEIIYITANK